MSVWVVGLELKSFREKFYELVKPALHYADCCQVSVNDVIACASGNQVFVNRLCFLELPLTDQCNSLLLLGGVIGRTLGDMLLGCYCWYGG